MTRQRVVVRVLVDVFLDGFGWPRGLSFPWDDDAKADPRVRRALICEWARLELVP